MKIDCVYIDSDGVIADFSGYCREHYGVMVDNVADPVEKKKFWKWVTARNEVEPFFYSLAKMDDADRLIDFCVKNFSSVKILTASGHTPKDVAAQKRCWYTKHYPGLDVLITRKSAEKAVYANASSILIDDRDKSIIPWQNAGGIGILHTSVDTTIDHLLTFI